jgi:hypothetical protein
MSNTILSYAEFARALGIKIAQVSSWIKRGKLIADTVNKKIDYSLPHNKFWIDRQVTAGKKFDLNRTIKNVKGKRGRPSNKESNEEPTNYQKLLYELDYKRKLADLEARQNANLKERIQIEKLQGLLLPVDAAQDIFLFAIENFRQVFSQELDAFANIFVERLGATDDQYKELQKEIAVKINECFSEAKTNIIEGLTEAIEKYKEVRGRGEKK